MPLFLCSSYRLTLIMPSANLTNSASSFRSLMVNRGPEMVYYQLFCIQRTFHSEDFPLFFTACLGWLSIGRGEESEINKSWILPTSFLCGHEPWDCQGSSYELNMQSAKEEASRVSGSQCMYVEARGGMANMQHCHSRLQ